MKSFILICCFIAFLSLSLFGAWYWKKNFFDPMIKEKIDLASDIKAQSIAEVLSEKKSEEIAAVKVVDRTRAIEQRLSTMQITLDQQNTFIRQIRHRLKSEELKNETLIKEIHLLKGSILCKEIEIQDLEVKLSNRNCQIQRLKYCRDQFNEIKNYFEYFPTLTKVAYQNLLDQTKTRNQR